MNILRINNFKCFDEIDIPLRQLTIMAGANGHGKSTSIQALLFLRYSVESNFILHDEHYAQGSLKLNNNNNIPINSGFLLSLGSSADIINRQSNKNEIELGVIYEDQHLGIEYLANNTVPELFVTATNCTENITPLLPLVQKEFYYLNAERIGPRLNQNVQFFDYPNAGWQGEFVAQLISERSGYLPVEKERLFGDTTNAGLEFQVNEWLNDIIPGVRVTAKRNPGTFTSQIQIENAYTKGDPILATNIGFGISYVLPILATGLVAKKGTYFIVENPEAHLHPSAQSKIGGFLAMVASAGVNVIIETHSDHLINGVQIAVAEGKVSFQDIFINFFQPSTVGGQPDVISIGIKERGELTDWPKGFFDQSQLDYSHLIRLRKHV